MNNFDKLSINLFATLKLFCLKEIHSIDLIELNLVRKKEILNWSKNLLSGNVMW